MITVPVTVSPQTTSVPVSVETSTESVPVTIDPEYVVEEHTEYTGEYSFTPGTETQTAQTAGKLLSNNITIAGDINLLPGCILEGKTLFGVAGTVQPYNWLGANAELIKTLTPYKVKLSDTAFPNWQPTTTATTIKTRTNNYDSFVVDMSQYEYSVVWDCVVNIRYNQSISGDIAQVKFGCVFVVPLFKRPTNNDNLIAKNYNGNVGGIMSVRYVYRYKKVNGTYGIAYESTQGLYFGQPNVTFVNTEADETTVKINTPTLYAKANESYAPSAVFAKIDQEKTEFVMKGYVYRTAKNDFNSALTKRLIDVFVGT